MDGVLNRMKISAVLILVVFVAACGERGSPSSEAPESATAPAAAPKTAAQPGTSPGKPGAPIQIDYRIVGVPVVGQPVTVELDVRSSLAVAELRVSYQVLDEAGLFLPETQAREALLTGFGEGEQRSQRVTVIPQSEGRYYLNVMVEMDTPEGLMGRAASIPIQIGSIRPAPRVNGQLQTDEQGEVVISMPEKAD
jgi:hypothetical protein